MLQGAESCIRTLQHRTWVALHSVRQRHLALSLSFPPSQPLVWGWGGFSTPIPTIWVATAGLQHFVPFLPSVSCREPPQSSAAATVHWALLGVLLFRWTVNHYSFRHSDSFSGSQNPRKGFCTHTFMSLPCRDFISVNKIIFFSVSFFSINISGRGNKRLESLLSQQKQY